MKNFKYVAVLCCSILCSALLLAGVYCTSIVDVVAYTAAETFTNADISTEYQNDTLDTIDEVFAELEIDSVLVITDLIRYLNQSDSNTFAKWVYENYGDEVELPESVKEMSAGEIIMYVSTKLFAGDATKETTTAGYTSIVTEKQTEATTNHSTTTVQPVTTTKLNGGAPTSYKTGDVDFNGDITAADARIVLRASAEIVVLSAIEFSVADVNDDGKITAKDARSILRYSAGLQKGL
ncbi:MAG: dockerin type I repeat-containing protein [Clostridia bacterium]|nr:dockerin type I repeat-containing protein [Clostridia bacterium]